MILKKSFFTCALIGILHVITYAQNDTLVSADFNKPKQYVIDTVTVSGVKYLDRRVLANMSGLATGMSITLPSDEITKVIRKFWEHGLFEDVQISYKVVSGNKVVIDIFLKERPRITKFNIEGVGKSDQSDLKEKLNFRIGSQLTENVINDAITIVKKFYNEKGFFNVKVEILQKSDTTRPNGIEVTLKINKNKRVKIADIVFTGNENIKASKLRKAMKNTKRRDWKFWNTSKYIEAKYKEDKANIINLYNEKGYRDAKILSDSLQLISDKRIKIFIKIFEGKKYYFRNITWVGNTKYPSDLLSNVLGIKKGEVFNQKNLDKRLQTDDDAVSSLYLDNGYLFFNVTPVESIDGDSIDFEMRIYEGKQASFNEIIISGNTKTNEHVVRRELRTIPGELFSKSDIVRSVRELATLGHFEPEKIEPVPIPNPANSTVDLQYKLVERANDQLELSGGWGGYYGFIGSIGIRFSNFSYRNIFNWKEWRPVPSGDGQTLSLSFRTNGTQYRSYSMTFADPWFGGKKPNAFSLTGFYSHYSRVSYNSITQIFQSTGSYINTEGISLSLGKRLKWPDDYFTLQQAIGFDRYKFKNYPIAYSDSATGSINNIYYSITFGRNSLDQFIYPRTGSWFSIGLQLTPPYSLLNGKDFTKLSVAEKYRWGEYHKWSIRAETYMTIVGNLVLMTRANFGIVGRYNKKVNYSPTEVYDMGGSGLIGYNITNSEIIPMRGYTDGALTPYVNGIAAGHIYDRFTSELRYPITLKEQATIYVAAFAEAGNAWAESRSFNPFDVKRAAGVGVRVFLPMFGMLGFDLGYGFDKVNGQKSGWQPQFVMGQQF